MHEMTLFPGTVTCDKLIISQLYDNLGAQHENIGVKLLFLSWIT